MEIHGGPSRRKRRKPADPSWVAFMSDDEKEEERIKHWQAVPLAEVGLSVRVVNAFEECNVMTVGDLCLKTSDELRMIPNLGEVTITRCIRMLGELKLPHRLTK